jgi:hypothetical protein
MVSRRDPILLSLIGRKMEIRLRGTMEASKAELKRARMVMTVTMGWERSGSWWHWRRRGRDMSGDEGRMTG